MREKGGALALIWAKRSGRGSQLDTLLQEANNPAEIKNVFSFGMHKVEEAAIYAGSTFGTRATSIIDTRSSTMILLIATMILLLLIIHNDNSIALRVGLDEYLFFYHS